MRKLLFLLAFLAISRTLYAWPFESGWNTSLRASSVDTDTTNFNSNLSSADDTVQKALDTLDETAGGGGGDITAVGDCATGACFNGTSGTILTFNNAGGDKTLDYDGTDFLFNAPLSVTGAFVASGLITGDAGLKTTNSATSAGFLDIFEDSDTGTNKIRFIAPSAITSDQTCILENDGNMIPDSCVGDGTDGGGAETNSLEVLTTGILTTEIPIGTAADTVVYAALSGDVTMTNAGVVTIGANTVALTTDTTGNYAAGDAEAGNALTGDTATAFFSAGTIEHERGGLEADISAYDGLIGITGGATYNVTGTTTQIIIFDGAGAPTVAALSGDATMTNAGVVTIGANTVALGTDTTGAYVSDLTAGTAIDVSGGGAETANVTVDWDSTEVEATTWGAGGNASNIWTFNLLGTDWTMTAGSALATFSGGVTADGKIIGNASLDVKNGATSSGILAIFEDSDAGTNKATFQVPSLSADTVYTWPSDDGDADQVLSTNGSGVLDWVTSSASGTNFTRSINQTAHGLAVQNVVRYSGTAYVKAQADSAANAEAVGIVSAVADADNFTLMYGGRITGLSSLTAGAVYFLDDDTAGLLTATEPPDSTDVSKPLLIADSTTTGYFFNMRGIIDLGGFPDKELWWMATGSEALEVADSIPPINKDAGTNIDQLTTDFDDSTDECRTVNFRAPFNIDTAGTVTFVTAWYSAATTTNNLIFEVRHNSGVAEGVDPDVALTVETAAADAVQGTAGQITVTTWTETVSNLGWVAGDFVDMEYCRDANNASDTLANDSKHKGFGIRIPMA